MWTNFKTIASEAIEAAIDIKEHIKEVTGEELEENYQEEEKELRNDEYADALFRELETAKAEVKKTNEKYQKALETWGSEKETLCENVRTLENSLVEKEKDYAWDLQNYQGQMQDLIRMKNKIQRELEKTCEELNQFKQSVFKEKCTDVELEKLSKRLKDTEAEKKDIYEDMANWKKKYEDFVKNEEDKVSRSFFIQFVSALSRNIYNFQERQEMIASLVNILHLTEEEKFLLGIESIKPEKAKDSDHSEVSLFEKFASFLSG